MSEIACQVSGVRQWRTHAFLYRYRQRKMRKTAKTLKPKDANDMTDRQVGSESKGEKDTKSYGTFAHAGYGTLRTVQ